MQVIIPENKPLEIEALYRKRFKILEHTFTHERIELVKTDWYTDRVKMRCVCCTTPYHMEIEMAIKHFNEITGEKLSVITDKDKFEKETSH